MQFLFVTQLVLRRLGDEKELGQILHVGRFEPVRKTTSSSPQPFSDRSAARNCGSAAKSCVFTPKGITEAADAAELCQNDPKDMDLPDQTYIRDDLTSGDVQIVPSHTCCGAWRM